MFLFENLFPIIFKMRELTSRRSTAMLGIVHIAAVLFLRLVMCRQQLLSG